MHVFKKLKINIKKLISQKVEYFLTPKNIKAYPSVAGFLIKSTNKTEKYITEEWFDKWFEKTPFDSLKMVYLLEATGKAEEYLTPEKIKKYFLFPHMSKLIKSTKKIEQYLTLEQIKYLGLAPSAVVDLIKATGKVEEYLTPEKIKEFQLSGDVIAELMITTGKSEEFFNKENLEKYGLKDGQGNQITKLILSTKRAEEFLTLEKIRDLGGLSRDNIIELINATRKKSDYVFERASSYKTIFYRDPITMIGTEMPEKHAFSILNIIKHSGGDIEKFLKEEENLSKWQLTFADVELALPKNYFTSKEKEALQNLDIDSIQSVIKTNKEDRNKIILILERLSKSNSGELRKIKNQMAFVILQNSQEYEKSLAIIEQIYLTKNIPEFGKRFLVFKELHPNFLGENINMRLMIPNEAFSNIPSLKSMTFQERKHTIYSDLLMCALESNNRELKSYLDTIEKGNLLYEQVLNGELRIKELDKTDLKIQILTQYASILNSLYNVSSIGKHEKVLRENNIDLETDLKELDKLFKSDENIHLNLPDRIIKKFGYWAGLTSLEQAKDLMNFVRDNTHKRNVELAQTGKFTLKKGDYIKGIERTEFFPSMLQNGIVAKDYLGESSYNDYTPLDTDIEIVLQEGDTIKQTLSTTGIAKEFTDQIAYSKSLGKILLVFSKDDFVKTRDASENIDEEAVEKCKKDKRNKECFYNNNYSMTNFQAYGIRTGIGSTNIRYIIADRYVDKLGLEIALNGFYIPIIDEDGKLLYTPKMYEQIREKMQGLSFYGETTFELDETAKNAETEKIKNIIDANKINADNKKAKIIESFKRVTEKMGLRLSEERDLNLTQNIIEFIDTGSTGRGTNEPGDGDFDFMVRMDRTLSDSPEEFKYLLRHELNRLSTPEKSDETNRGDFRYKGITIEGLDKKIDLDLTFTDRTSEISYSTEESINDRLKTIRENSEEDYKYVIANILLAKKFLKSVGVYKKQNAANPINGEKDTRGGLGAIGIENWILQNGGSFEKASREFLEKAGILTEEGIIKENARPIEFEKFKKIYTIWDFGENWTSIKENFYAHDNFINNMSADGYEKMTKALREYIKTIDLNKKNNTLENKDSEKIGLSNIIQQDMSVLEETPYIQSVRSLLDKSKGLMNSKSKD